MEDRSANYVKCPYCDNRITHLSFRMIAAGEERYSEDQIESIRGKIDGLKRELEERTDMDTPNRVLYGNRIERMEADVRGNLLTYRQRVYFCPECEKILAIVPSNEINTIIEAINDITFDIRKLK